MGRKYQNDIQVKTITFRVDDPDRDGYKRIVCGLCAPEGQHTDTRSSGGEHLCEVCGLEFVRQDAHGRALKLVKITL